MKTITKADLESYRKYLINEEKSSATVEKYVRDVAEFSEWLGAEALEKSTVLSYKSKLVVRYLATSVNVTIAALNSFFKYKDRHDLTVKSLKFQRQTFSSAEKSLSRAEYERLLEAAKARKSERLYLLMQTVCSTGIRISELSHITVEAVERSVASIDCKGKRRQILLPKQLCKLLKQYIKHQKIKSGAVFVTRNGNPLDRSNVWSDMKKLCKAAKVSESKVFPHNLRHLFARTYYKLRKDVVRLADILGHSNVNTTRIYTMESLEARRKQIQGLGLLLC